MRASLIAAATAALLVAPAAFGASVTDVDGDGLQDVISGMPGWSPGGAPNAGAVLMIPGDGLGLARRPFLLMEGRRGVRGVAQGDDAFGSAVAPGDFDGNGALDVAVWAPGDGRTFVLPGPLARLEPGTGRRIPRGGPLVAADLDRDGDDELVAGRPFADRRNRRRRGSGAVLVYAGSSRGLHVGTPRRLEPVRGHADDFGEILATGDVNGDGRPDIVAGASGYPGDIDGGGRPGHLAYCPGTARGARRCRLVSSDVRGGLRSLTVADIDADGYDDVIAGRPTNRYVIDTSPPGAVTIWPGSARGPSRTPRAVTQHTRGVPGRHEPGDGFGAAVAASDVDRDGFADVIVGAPGENGGRGSVTVLRGGPAGIARAGHHRLRALPPRRGARFGAALTVLRQAGGTAVVVGAPGERALTVYRGRARGRPQLVQRLRPASLSLRVPPEPPDALGGFAGHLVRVASS